MLMMHLMTWGTLNCNMKYEYTYISHKDFAQAMSQVSNLAKQGWRLISTVTRGGSYKFVLEKEEQ